MIETFVYLVRPVGQAGPVKIGCSEEPVTRLSTLMTWSSVQLEVAATIPGGSLKLERRIHGIFADQHSHREWFHASKRLTGFIAAIASGTPIGELIDLSCPVLPFRTYNRKGNITPDRRRYLSYAARIRHAERRLWDDPDKRRYAPRDVDQIMILWAGIGRFAPGGGRSPRTPTLEEIARINAVLANFPAHAITMDERYPQKQKEAE